ncbi:MAG: hypothetical protein KF852_04135 [Saprospiraceae bacterium]|nr:hypothetical protein [Saprospiraceae bacterium]
MKINLNIWTTRPFPADCAALSVCGVSIVDALTTLNAQFDPDSPIGVLPGGHIVKPYWLDIAHPDARAVDQLIGISNGMIMFGVDRGGGNEIIVAKLTRAQANSRNISRMIQEILKLRPTPDGGALYNPDFGLIHIGKSTDAPGGSLIGLNPLNNEVDLDFDKSGLKNLLDVAKFAGLLGLAFFLFDKTKKEKGTF